VEKHNRLFVPLTLYEDAPPEPASFQLVLVIRHWCAATSLKERAKMFTQREMLKQDLINNSFNR